METTTKPTIEKIKADLVNEFMPFAEQMRREGCSDRDIQASCRAYYDRKQRQFFKQTASLSQGIDSVLTTARQDSRIEGRFFASLEQAGIRPRFQYDIPPYRVDYLLDDFLVLEIDGPTHDSPEAKKYDERRDRYLRRLGYDVLRVPVFLVTAGARAIIDELKSIIAQRKNRKLPRAGNRKPKKGV